MKNKIAILIVAFFIGMIQTYAQNGNYNINPNTKQVTNLDVRYDFNYVYSYDFDLNRQTSEIYPADCIVIINISDDGTGKLITSMDGQKGVLTLVSCYRYDTYYLFNLLNPKGHQTTAKMNIANGHIDKFWIIKDDNIALVFM